MEILFAIRLFNLPHISRDVMEHQDPQDLQDYQERAQNQTGKQEQISSELLVYQELLGREG